MGFLHVFLIPSIFFICSIIFHLWIDQKEFNQMMKIFSMGIASGLIMRFFYGISDIFFRFAAKPTSIILKSFIFDGLIFSIIIIFSLYIIFYYILGIQLTVTWSLTSIMIFAFLSGFYSIINMLESLKSIHPNSVFYYFYFFSYLLTVSIILGFGIPNYLDSTEFFEKFLWAFFSFGLTILISTLFAYFKFYQSIWQLLIVVMFIITAALFEFFDFKDFRK